MPIRSIRPSLLGRLRYSVAGRAAARRVEANRIAGLGPARARDVVAREEGAAAAQRAARRSGSSDGEVFPTKGEQKSHGRRRDHGKPSAGRQKAPAVLNQFVLQCCWVLGYSTHKTLLLDRLMLSDALFGLADEDKPDCRRLPVIDR